MVKSVYRWLPVAAAAIAVFLFAMDYLNLRSQVRDISNDLTNCRERNSSLIGLVVSFIADGRANLGQVLPLLSEAQAVEVKGQVKEAVELSLPMDIDGQFYPSGWMGDGKHGTQFVSLRRVQENINGRDVIAIRNEYIQGPEGWAGLYWQYPDGNWGQSPGRTFTGAKAVTFFAKGEAGGEIVEFKSGGINGQQYEDSYEASTGKVKLKADWYPYRINLSQADLTTVIGAFAWVTAGADNGGRLVMYIADIKIE